MKNPVLMPMLTDRQRIELAVPAYLFYALVVRPGIILPVCPAVAARAEFDITELRADLFAACLEPFADLRPEKRQALVRRLERIARGAAADWHKQQALGLMLALWNFLADLTEREVLLLWEGSAMDRATRRLLPMFERGFGDEDAEAAAAEEAARLLLRLQAEGLYL